MESTTDSSPELNHRLRDGVHLVCVENVFSYITRWGNIRDVYALIGSIVRQFFDHGISIDELKSEAFQALYIAMYEYDGGRAICEYTSYHIFRATRRYIECVGQLENEQPFCIMVRPRQFLLRFHLNLVPERAFNCSLDYLAYKNTIASTHRADTSSFWDKAEQIALSLNGKTERNWEIVKSAVSRVPYRDIRKWHSLKSQGLVTQTMKNTARRMAPHWNYEEARALVYA
jgi:hypothetical protein